MIADIREIMNPRPLTLIRPDDRVGESLKKMHEANVRSLPVVDSDGSFVGLFSIYQLVRAMLPKAALAKKGGLDDLAFVSHHMEAFIERLNRLVDKPVSEFLEKKKHVTICTPETPLMQLLFLLERNRTSLPVVVVEGKRKKLVGIVSYWDILAKMAMQLYPKNAEGSPGESASS